MKKWIALMVLLAASSAFAAPPSPPLPPKITAAQVASPSGDTSWVIVNPDAIYDIAAAVAGEGSIEVQNEAFSVGNASGDATHAPSQDSMHDWAIQFDTDLDGDVDVIDATVWATKQDASTAATDTEVSTAVSDHAALADPHTGYLLESLFNAHTVVYATTDNTPAALTVDEQRVVGRATGGNISALTLGNAATNVAQWPADPAAHTLFGFDNTGNIYRPITIGTGLSYDQASNTITATGSALSDLDDLPGDSVDDNLIDAALLASITATQLDPVLTFADGDLIDLSGITHTGDADEGLALPAWANVVPTSNKKFLAADGSNLKLYNGGWVTIGATAAPTDAQYLTLALDATLSAERVLTAGSDGIDFTDAGANGALTITVDATEIGTETWGAGAGITWTFDASAGTDPTIAFGNGSITASVLTVTGALTANGGVTLQTTDHLTLGTSQWDNGADKIDGEQIADDTIDDDSIDFSDVTLADFVTPTTQYNVLATADGTTWSTVDLDANYLPATTMYSGGSGYGGLIFGDSTPDAAGEIGYASNVVSFYDGTASRTLATLATNQAFTGNNTFAGTSGFNGEITMGADFNLNANEIQSTGNIVLQLGDAAGSNKFSIQDSGGVEVFSVNSDGGMASGAVADPYIYFNDNDMATEFAIRSIDTTVDHLAIGTTTDAMAANFTELGYFDADELYYAGDIDISTGHVYRINGTQINIGNLGAGGNWTPTGTINMASATLQNIGAGTVTNGASYTTISNNAAHDTVNELFAAINTWASGVSAGTLVSLSDVGGGDVYTAGYLLVGDGTDSYDPKEVTGAITINSSGVTALTVADSTDATSYVAIFDSATGSLSAKTDTGITYDATTGNLTVTGATVGALTGVNSIDATGAVDMDYGSADVTDHTFVADGGTVILDGTITLPNSETIGNGDDTEIAFGGTEALALDLDTGTANQVAWKNKTTGSTGITAMDFGAFNLSTTGTIQGSAKFNSYVAARTATQADNNGGIIQMTTADEVTMWDCTTSTVGNFVTMWARDAEKIEVVPASGDQFYLFDGTGIGANDELDIAATAGTKVTLMCTAENEWRVFSETAACADGGAAD